MDCQGYGSGSRMQPCHNPGAGPAFATQPLTQRVEVTGEPTLEVSLSLDDATDANVFAYLEDVAPDGTVRVVTEGRQKVSLRATHPAQWAMPPAIPWHRNYAQDSQPVEPGEGVTLSFAMMPTSWVFNPGHRIQLTITGADYRERVRIPAEAPMIRLQGGVDRPASLSLPIR